METTGLLEFDDVLAQLRKDLGELETVSRHLQKIDEYASNLNKFDERFQKSLTSIDSQVSEILGALDQAANESKNGLVKNINAIKKLADLFSSLNEKYQANDEALSQNIVRTESLLTEFTTITSSNLAASQELSGSLRDFTKQRKELSANLNAFLEGNKQLDATAKSYTSSIQHASQSIIASAEKIDSQVANTQALINDFLKVDQQITVSVKSIQQTLQKIGEIKFTDQFNKLGAALITIWDHLQKAQKQAIDLYGQTRTGLNSILGKLEANTSLTSNSLKEIEQRIDSTQNVAMKAQQDQIVRLETKLKAIMGTIATETSTSMQSQIAALKTEMAKSLQQLRTDLFQALFNNQTEIKKRILFSEMIVFAGLILVILIMLIIFK